MILRGPPSHSRPTTHPPRTSVREGEQSEAGDGGGADHARVWIRSVNALGRQLGVDERFVTVDTVDDGLIRVQLDACVPTDAKRGSVRVGAGRG